MAKISIETKFVISLPTKPNSLKLGKVHHAYYKYNSRTERNKEWNKNTEKRLTNILPE